MEPLSAGAIITLVLKNGFEEIGKKLGGKVLELANKLARLLKAKFPDATDTIKKAGPQSEDYIQAVLEIEAAVKTEPEIAEMIQSVADAIFSQKSFIYNNSKLAEKTVNINQAQIIHQTQTNHL